MKAATVQHLNIVVQDELAVKATFHVKNLTHLNNIIVSFITYNGGQNGRTAHYCNTIHILRRLS